MQECHIVVEGDQLLWRLHMPVTEGCGVLNTPDRSLFSESDNALPVKMIRSCGVVLVLSASAMLATYWASIGECFMLIMLTYASMEHFKSNIYINVLCSLDII